MAKLVGMGADWLRGPGPYTITQQGTPENPTTREEVWTQRLGGEEFLKGGLCEDLSKYEACISGKHTPNLPGLQQFIQVSAHNLSACNGYVECTLLSASMLRAFQSAPLLNCHSHAALHCVISGVS